MRVLARGGLQRRHDDVLDLVQQDRRRPARPRLIVPGRPGAAAMNRARHRSTVDSSTPRSAATCLFVPPSAQASTIFARSARYWAVFARRAHRISCARSASARTSSALGRPIGAASSSPASRWSANWRRHFDTDLTATPSACAAPAFDIPLGTGQDDPGPVSPPALRQPRPAHQLSPLIIRQHDLAQQKDPDAIDRQPSKNNPQKLQTRHTSALTMNVHRVMPLVVGPSVGGVRCGSGPVPGVVRRGRRGGGRGCCASAGRSAADAPAPGGWGGRMRPW